jgi:ribosomal protein S27E
MTVRHGVRWMSGAIAASVIAGCGPDPARSQASDATDFLIQMVCVDASDRPVFADPVDCPASRRKLRPGEPLPYHKVDVGGYQISDSFPVDDPDPNNFGARTLGVQTYFFTDAWDLDPAFPRQVRLDPARGGYNIMGADADWVAFLGTSDPGAYWQPWWRPDCELGGWRLFPNNDRAFRGGEAASPTTFAPNCEQRIRTSAARVEWRFVADQPYVIDPADETKTRRLDSLLVRHFASGYGSMETNWFTREYGATRWEAWRAGEGLTPEFLKARCPASTYDAVFHGRAMSMVDCRTWTTLIRPAGGSWDPNGASAVDPTIRTFPVDPLYLAGNLLFNSHLGGPYTPDGRFACETRAWDSEGDGAALSFGEVASAPWNGNGACVYTVRATASPSRDWGQTIDAPPPGEYRFGASLFAPDLTAGQRVLAEIAVTQLDAEGQVIATERLPVRIIDRYRTFEGNVAVLASARMVRLGLRSAPARIEVGLTGAFITKR